MLRTRLCELLHIEVPIVAAPMGPDITTPELAAAVSNAGGLGLVSFGGNPPPLLRELIRRVRVLTDRPFGVNVLLPLAGEEQILVCIEERVPVLSFFWGDARPWVVRAHAAGIKVVDQVGSVAAARQSAEGGVDVVIAQGLEAGGHVAGRVATMVLVPRVVDAVAPTPVVAAGGIADARGLVAALALGAEGVVLGTRFLATLESAAHPLYKERILAASEEDTVHTTLFGVGWPDAPHRALRTPFVEKWLGEPTRPDGPPIGERPLGGRRIPVPPFAAAPPSAGTTGDVESMSLLAGQSVGLVHDVRPAANVVRDLVAEAERIVTRRLDAVVAAPGRG
jgi:NAD(P)H-dependent flavin oxidoreductase YrpB (nitropropane dioxygenase family)